jgi:hypothetical protein
VLIEPEPMLPTRGYRVLCHDATLIDLEQAPHLDPPEASREPRRWPSHCCAASVGTLGKRRVNDEGKLYKECARCEKCAEEQGSPANNFWGFVGGNG